MPGRIPEEFIEDLRHRVDIVEVIRDYVPLKKQGQNYTGLCPFHAEKTPSFVVSPQKQIYHCFGCGKGGYVFTFLMEKNGVSFPEAVEMLAQRYGISLPKRDISPERAKRESLRKRYYHINELAAQFYQRMLQASTGENAVTYLGKRGVDPDACNRFHLGFAPPSWDQLSRFLIEQGIKENELVILGLAVKNQRGYCTDKFRNRIIYPITDERGRVIGFGGRVMDDSYPKYLNSPDTPLFNKGRQLYGLGLAKNNIRRKDQALIMEGYMDVIAAHKHGIDNTVGSLGTALTKEQARLLQRYTYNINICFDTDAAGQEATLRGMEILRQQGCRVSVVVLPEAKDPDEFLQNKGAASFASVVQAAPSLLEYKLAVAMNKFDYGSLNGKTQLIQHLLPDLLSIQGPVERQAFIQLLAEKLHLPENIIHAEMKKKASSEVGTEVAVRQQAPKTAWEKAERALLRIVLENHQYLAKVEEQGGKDLFKDQIRKEIYQTHLLMHQTGHNIEANDLAALLTDEKARQHLTELLLEEDPFCEKERVFADCVRLLQLECLDKRINEKTMLITQYERNGDSTGALRVMAQIQELVKEKQIITSSLRKGGDTVEDREGFRTIKK